MAILVGSGTAVVVQGATGRQGAFHTRSMLQYGTKVLAGVTPMKGGQRLDGIPIYNTVEEAVRSHPEINTSLIMVPAPNVADAVYEAVDAGLRLLVIITEHVPIHDTISFLRYARLHGVEVVGPNCPGVITPGEAKVGIMPGHIFRRGVVGMVSRSGTLTYEIAYGISKLGLGQTTAVGIGGDPITGLDFIEVLTMFEKDNDTKAVVLIGEIGGDMEERAAEYIRVRGFKKPVVAYVAGVTAPPEKRMGHAGAIISMGMGDYESKVKALRSAGVHVASTPSEVSTLLSKLLAGVKA
ncbi:Succinate--CoA ligase [ADP-forming] subunit alpha [archaeon HR01]|nr:Succinate--CoA ligase [ADP-forming] subunit alpha [archaeon HR01]